MTDQPAIAGVIPLPDHRQHGGDQLRAVECHQVSGSGLVDEGGDVRHVVSGEVRRNVHIARVSAYSCMGSGGNPRS